MAEYLAVAWLSAKDLVIFIIYGTSDRNQPSSEYKVRNPQRNIRYIIMLHDDIEKGPKQGPLEGSVFSTD